MRTLNWPALTVVTCCVTTVLIHVIVLSISTDDALSTPIAGLSQGSAAWLQGVGLLSFALAHGLLAIRLNKACFSPSADWIARFLFVLIALCLVEASIAFSKFGASLSGVGASNSRLIVIACLAGLLMALIWFQGSRVEPRLWRLNMALTIVWMVLAPVGAFVTDGWVGGYERLAGATYVIWVLCLALNGIAGHSGDTAAAAQQS